MTQTAVSAPLGPRAALDPLHHLADLGARGMAGGEARAPARAGDAPADRPGAAAVAAARSELEKAGAYHHDSVTGPTRTARGGGRLFHG